MRDFSDIAIFERKFFYMSEEIEIKDEVLDLKVTETYDENQIQVLEGLEAVRKRPGMYIGSTSARGLHHLVYEIVDNSIDEALAGYCTHIEVTIEKGDIIRVTDNGRGIPCGIHPQMGIPTLEVVLTVRRTMSTTSNETTIKAVFAPTDTIFDVYRKMNEKIDEIKYGGEDNNTEQVAGALLKLPRFLLRFAIGCLRVMDYFGIIPQKLLDASPFHGSMIITDMGSLGIPPIYHHLYNFGTLPMFIAFGAKRKAVELDREGKAVERKYIDFMAVMDERVCDGYYYASSFKYMKMFMHNPSLLEVPPENVVEDLF